MDLQLPTGLILLTAKQVHFHRTKLPVDMIMGVTTAVQAHALSLLINTLTSSVSKYYP